MQPGGIVVIGYIAMGVIVGVIARAIQIRLEARFPYTSYDHGEPVAAGVFWPIALVVFFGTRAGQQLDALAHKLARPHTIPEVRERRTQELEAANDIGNE